MKSTFFRPCYLFIIFIFAALPSNSHAHRMLVDCMVEDGTVLADVFFPNGRPAQNVEIEVYNSDETLYISGKTDSEGRFTFDPKGKTYLKVVAIGELGHKAEQELSLGKAPSQPLEGSEQDDHIVSTARRRESIPLREIFAGFGYIFGAAGILMYIKTRLDLKKVKSE